MTLQDYLLFEHFAVAHSSSCQALDLDGGGFITVSRSITEA